MTVSVTSTITQTAKTEQPHARHHGIVSDYPEPDGDGWQFVYLQFDDESESVIYHWSRTTTVPPDRVVVAIDPALVAQIRKAETTWYAREGKIALADHVLAQLGGR